MIIDLLVGYLYEKEKIKRNVAKALHLLISKLILGVEETNARAGIVAPSNAYSGARPAHREIAQLLRLPTADLLSWGRLSLTLRNVRSVKVHPF